MSVRQSPKVKIHGACAAMSVEGTFGRSDGLPTVNLEIAPKTGKTHVLWEKKISIQLSQGELSLLAGLCLGHCKRLEFKRPDKGLRIEHQGDKVFCSASSSQGRFALPISCVDLYSLVDLLLSRLLQASHSRSAPAVLAAIESASRLIEQ